MLSTEKFSFRAGWSLEMRWSLVFMWKMIDVKPLVERLWLGGGFKYFFYVHPYSGKIPILTNIFQMSWFNHQLDEFL